MTDANNQFSSSINLSTILTDNTLAYISSSRTTGGDSCIYNSTTVKQAQEPSSLNQIDSDKIDSHLLATLNQDFVELGFPAIVGKYTPDVNCSQLVKNAADVLLRLKRSTSQIEKTQDQYYKLDHDNELLLKRYQYLKDTCDASARDLSLNKEKFRQLQLKVDESTKTIKILNEQVKKIQAQKEQRDKLFKNERSKIEKETEKLKARIQALTAAKARELQSVDLTEALFKNPSKNSGSLESPQKRQIESYVELIRDYDRKTKELMMEGSDLKSFITNTFMNVHTLVGQHHDTMGNVSVGSSVGSGEEAEYEPDFEELIKLPFESVQQKLALKFDEKFRVISQAISNRTLGFGKARTTSQEENLSLSTINLSETKVLNDTYTLKKGGCESSSIGSSSQSSIRSANDCSKVTSNIYDERMSLAEEKRLMYEEKLRIEQEAKYQRNVSLKLQKKQHDFQKDQDNFYKAKLCSSFSKSSDVTQQ